MKRIIINADDYGMFASVSRGIRQAHQEGIVSSTSAMMNFPYAEQALKDAVNTCPRLGMGVHLVLTAGAPVRPARKVPSLVTGSGEFYSPGDPSFPVMNLDTDELSDEWNAQIERFINLIGFAPDHLDSHHFISYATPVVLDVMVNLAEAYNLPIRLPVPLKTSGEDPVSGFPERFPQEMLSIMENEVNERGIHCPEAFIASFYGEEATVSRMDQALSSAVEGITEIMCHPGICDSELRSVDAYCMQREMELEVLTDTVFQDRFSSRHLELTTFAALCDGESL